MQEMIQSMFTFNDVNKPDFILKNKGGSSTEIYLDKATKFDLIINTFKNKTHDPQI